MQLRAPAILLAARPHGETAVVARLLTEEAGVVAGYVAGGRGRQLRPVVIPGNLVEADIRGRSARAAARAGPGAGAGRPAGGGRARAGGARRGPGAGRRRGAGAARGG